MKIKDVIASCLIISLGIILVGHFILFWIYGGVFIYENNKIVLFAETIMSIAILGFGIERLLTTGSTRDYQEVSAMYNDELSEQDYTGRIDTPDMASGEKAQTSATDTMSALRPNIINMSVGNSDKYIDSLSYEGSHNSLDERNLHNNYPALKSETDNQCQRIS